jgi:predicted nucleic acid-binding protein
MVLTLETLLMNRVFIDTNVLVYAYDANSIFHERANAFLLNTSLDFYVSSKNISEFFAVLTKLNEPFANIFQFYQDIRLNTTLLFPDNTSIVIFETLMKKYQPKGNRIFDVEIVSIAVANGISEIATVNTKDFLSITEISVLSI